MGSIKNKKSLQNQWITNFFNQNLSYLPQKTRNLMKNYAVFVQMWKQKERKSDQHFNLKPFINRKVRIERQMSTHRNNKNF